MRQGKNGQYRIPKYRTMLVRDGAVAMPYQKIGGFESARDLFHGLLNDSPVERVFVAYLNGQNGLIGVECVAQGGLHGASLLPREVFRGAILACASAILMAHNHPSGDPTPSDADTRMTRMLVEASEVVGIPILDHIIVTERRETASSMLNLGLLKPWLR